MPTALPSCSAEHGGEPAIGAGEVSLDLTIKPAPIRKTLVVRAAPEKAFEIFTADFDCWWPRTHHVGETPLKAVILEPGVGGRWYSSHEGGAECNWGEVLIWEPPARLVLAWRIDHEFHFDPNLLTEVELRFTGLADGRTQIDFEHRHLERFGLSKTALQTVTSMDGGWAGILSLYQARAEQ
jgi:uncharacterized protein YndB with AHSA1/START domain